ncbi:Metacaspase 2 [Plasmodium coatneyi]|uniref:Metacaspase 2 n=1 Tax=Plasmodium coatneyi TaxID=208452 RepID=A0A1B1E5H3_9APIC|nr:Metacaspase 2 [Plasmodium coatneyi]ANQ10245.1 Metacaspase 2 [Plasmodium coatneyi]
MNNVNTYSPLYSSYENINIYKKNKQLVGEDYDTSTANISCDSRGRILIKDIENDNKNIGTKINGMANLTHGVKNTNQHEKREFIPPVHVRVKSQSSVTNNQYGKNSINDNSIPTKKYLHPISGMQYGNVLRSKDSKSMNDIHHVYRNEGILNNNVNCNAGYFAKYHPSYIASLRSQGDSFPSGPHNMPNYNPQSIANNFSSYQMHDVKENRNILNEFNKNIYQHYSRIVLDDYNKQVQNHPKVMYPNEKFQSYDKNYHPASPNNNRAFLSNAREPVNFYSNNNITLKNYVPYGHRDLQNGSHIRSGSFILSSDTQKNTTLHMLNPTQNIKDGSRKNVFKIFNRKKEPNKNLTPSVNSYEHLPNVQKGQRRSLSSVNQTNLSSTSFRRKVNSQETSSWKREANNNTLRKIYNFIFPSSANKSQNGSDAKCEVNKFATSPRDSSLNEPYPRCSNAYLLHNNSNQNKAFNMAGYNLPDVHNANVIRDYSKFNYSTGSANAFPNISFASANNPDHLKYTPPAIVPNGRDEIMSLRKDDQFAKIYSANKAGMPNGNPRISVVSQKHANQDDRHRYHEKLVTNIYQFTGGLANKGGNHKNGPNNVVNNGANNHLQGKAQTKATLPAGAPMQPPHGSHVLHFDISKDSAKNGGPSNMPIGSKQHQGEKNNTAKLAQNKNTTNEQNELCSTEGIPPNSHSNMAIEKNESPKGESIVQTDNNAAHVTNNNTTKKVNQTFNEQMNHVHRKSTTTDNNSIKIVSDHDRNSSKQNIYNYSTVIQNNFINGSDKMSKILVGIKNENGTQNKNNANLEFVNVNKYINNIFKTGNNNYDYTGNNKGGVVIGRYGQGNNIAKNNPFNQMDIRENTKWGMPNQDSSKMYQHFNPSDDHLMNNAHRLRELEKKHGVISNPNLCANDMSGMNENAKHLMRQCILNKFLYEQKKQENQTNGRKKIIPNMMQHFMYVNEKGLESLPLPNDKENPIVKLLNRGKQHRPNVDGKINLIDRNAHIVGMLKKLHNVGSEDDLPDNVIANLGQIKLDHLSSLTKNEINKYMMCNNSEHNNQYIKSIASMDDKVNYHENDCTKGHANRGEHHKEGTEPTASQSADAHNITLKKEKKKKSGKKKKSPKNVHHDIDQMLELKSKVYDELNTCLKCINNLTKNKKLFEQLKKYKNKLDKKAQMGDDTSARSRSDQAESYYTMRNSYLSSFLCNENTSADAQGVQNAAGVASGGCITSGDYLARAKNTPKLHPDRGISNGTGNNVTVITPASEEKNELMKKINPTSIAALPIRIDNSKNFTTNKACPNQFQDKQTLLNDPARKKDNVHFNLCDKSVFEGEEREKNSYGKDGESRYSLYEEESPNVGKRKALLVTLNYNGLLEGCVNDTLEMCEHLVETFKFNELILLNDCNFCYRNFVSQKANKNNIINNLYEFVVNSNNGDILFFYFCGYSIKIIDSKFSQNNNFALLPEDYSKNNYIYSNEVFNIIKKLQGGKQLCIVFDTTYTSYFVPTCTTITYNKSINSSEISKNTNLVNTNKKHIYSLRTFGKFRDRHVEPIYVENLKMPLSHDLYKQEEERKQNAKDVLVPSIFFFSPDVRDRGDFELVIRNRVRGLLTYCIGKAITMLKKDFSYHDLFIVASQVLVNIKKEYKLKYVKFKLSFLNDHSPDDIKFLSHESLLLRKKGETKEEPLWKPSLRLNNLNEYMKDICKMKEKKTQVNFPQRCLLIFIKDIKFGAHIKLDPSIEYFVSCFVKAKGLNILYVRRNNTKCQKIVRDKIFFLEYIILNVSDLDNTKIYVELFKKKNKNYFLARSVLRISNTNGNFSLMDEKKNIIGIIDLSIKCVS